jgi:hypothetical protein
MRYEKVLLGAVSEASYSDNGTVKFKIPGEVNEQKGQEYLNRLAELLAVDNKVITNEDSVYNDESFTLFIVEYKKTSVDKLFRALVGTQAICHDLNNMHGTMEISDNLDKIMLTI